MKVFVAGAGGVVGQRLVPALIRAGHTVGALTRTEGKRQLLAQAGATVFIADALDAGAVRDAVEAFRPEAIVNQLTAIPQQIDLRHFDRDFALTNRLRIEGTDNLIAAGEKVGAVKFISQSYAGWPYARTGNWVKEEADPLDTDPPRKFRSTLEAIKHLESAVLSKFSRGGVVLRYGSFYGPGTALSKGGAVFEAVKKRKLPIVAGGTGVWSFVHIDDAASATVAALGGRPGIYNVVDDQPAPVNTWILFLAEVLRAKTPRHIPGWVARPLIGEHGVAMMRDTRGASNEKARRELDWRPAYPSWRDGFWKEVYT
jgi:nucleoside-diphosphate-sugar epimerase